MMTALVAMVAAVACGNANDSQVTSPASLPAGLPPNGSPDAIPGNLRPALDDLAELMESYGSQLLVPGYIPQGLVLTRVGPGDNGQPAGVNRAPDHFSPPGMHSVLHFEVPGEFVYLQVHQVRKGEEEKTYLPLDDQTAVTPLISRRQTTQPDGTQEVEDVRDAGFIASFRDRGESVQVVAQAHRCFGDGCFNSWCTDRDCPKFPEPVAVAIITSLGPYAP